MTEVHEEPPPDIMREASEVARRCCVLIGIVSLGHQRPLDATVGWLMDEGLWDFVTPKERAFIMDSSPSQQSIVDATWRAEALHVLLWSLSRIESLSPPTQQCEVDPISGNRKVPRLQLRMISRGNTFLPKQLGCPSPVTFP